MQRTSSPILLLDAAIDTHVPHHTITVRVHKNTPEKLMVKALECVRSGIGMPAFVGDESNIEFFIRAAGQSSDTGGGEGLVLHRLCGCECSRNHPDAGGLLLYRAAGDGYCAS